MAHFTDRKNNTWALDITTADVKRVRRVLDVDLLKGPSVFSEVLTDPVQLVDVLYVLLQPVAEAKGISDVDFGAAMAGDSIDAATDALLEAFVAFSPARQREAMRALWEKQKGFTKAAADRVTALINDPQTEAKMMAELEDEIHRLTGGRFCTN